MPLDRPTDESPPSPPTVPAPRISVLLTVYNAEEYVADAVESILGQSYPDFELLIVDDGSTDGSLDRLRELAARDARIRLESRPNTGLVPALNELLEVARGEYLARMDADDVSREDRFERQLAFLDAHPEVVCLGTATDQIDERSRLIRRPPLATTDHAIQEELLSGHNPLCHPTVMMRASVVRQVGGYDPASFPAEDLDLWLRMGEAGRLANLPERLVCYRIYDRSISSRQQSEQLEKKADAARRAWQRRGLPERELDIRPWRAGEGRESRVQFLNTYGWGAFMLGERRTAAVYGLRLVATAPLRIDGWKLLACALVKPAPEAQTP